MKRYINYGLAYLRKEGANMINTKQINLIVEDVDKAAQRFCEKTQKRELPRGRFSRFYRNLLALKSKIIAKRN